MAVYSNKSESRQLNANLTAELTQALSLLNTAQQELSEKKELLKETSKLVETIENYHNNLENLREQSTESVNQINADKSQASKTANEIETLLETTKSEKNDFDALTQNNKTLNDKLNTLSKELEELYENCKKYDETIASILPKAASAGLASAFSTRGEKLEATKRIWMGIFIVSLTALGIFAWHLIGIEPRKPSDFWNEIIIRLPLAAPLIWLGWFSAIQYGNTIRIQEDYAFKEATSKTFQGYRDHMEHLESVNADEAQTALSLLSEKTIEILAREPLRIYGKSEHDATPARGILSALNSRRQSKTEDE